MLATVPAELAGVRLDAQLVRAWPGMDARAATRALLPAAAALLGRPIVGSERGGASDASHFASRIPLTIDGLGPRGGGAHHPDEWVGVASLRNRAEVALAVLGSARARRAPARAVRGQAAATRGSLRALGRRPPTPSAARPCSTATSAAGARLVPFAGWEMPVQYEGIRAEHVAVRTGAGVFDVSHMGEIETSGPQARGVPPAHPLQRRTKLAERGAQYSVLCREDGGVLDDLFTYRLDERPLPDGHQRLQPRARTSPGSSEQAERLRRRGRRTPHADWAMLAVQGPRRARHPRARWPTGELPKRMRTAELDARRASTAWSAAPATPARTAASCCCRPSGAGAVWDALLAAGVTPVGLGARDTLRLEVCFHLYGNDLSEDRNPIEAGLGWCCKLDTGFIGAEALRGRRARADAGARSPSPDRGIPRQGNPILRRARRGRRHQRQPLALPRRSGIGMAYVPVADAEPGTADRGRRAGQAAPRARSGASPSTTKET